MARELESLRTPEAERLKGFEDELTDRLDDLEDLRRDHEAWVERHPEAARRLSWLDTEHRILDRRLEEPSVVPQRVVGFERGRPAIEHSSPLNETSAWISADDRVAPVVRSVRSL